MPTRLTSVVIDAADPPTLARWWAQALGWELGYEDDDESDVTPPPGEPGIELTFVPVEDAKRVQNRIHLDLRSSSLADQDEQVLTLMASGAVETDIDQGDVPWAVLLDPEGNEFCVLEPRPEYADTGRLAAIVVQALDPAAMAAFWAQASGLRPRDDAAATDNHDLRPLERSGPWLEFVDTVHPHTVKNRLHLDVAPYQDDDQSAEVDRLLALGARPAEVGQSAADHVVTWVVLADPEDNEFCVLSSRG